MTETHKALYAFWSSFGVPAYLTGHVPENTPFPYITFEVVASESFAVSNLSAICWFKAKSGVNVNKERAEMLDAIARAIPDEGTLIDTDSGKLALRRNYNFQSYYDDPEDKSVVGGLTSYQISFYTR